MTDNVLPFPVQRCRPPSSDQWTLARDHNLGSRTIGGKSPDADDAGPVGRAMQRAGILPARDISRIEK